MTPELVEQWGVAMLPVAMSFLMIAFGTAIAVVGIGMVRSIFW